MSRNDITFGSDYKVHAGTIKETSAGVSGELPFSYTSLSSNTTITVKELVEDPTRTSIAYDQTNRIMYAKEFLETDSILQEPEQPSYPEYNSLSDFIPVIVEDGDDYYIGNIDNLTSLLTAAGKTISNVTVRVVRKYHRYNKMTYQSPDSGESASMFYRSTTAFSRISHVTGFNEVFEESSYPIFVMPARKIDGNNFKNNKFAYNNGYTLETTIASDGKINNFIDSAIGHMNSFCGHASDINPNYYDWFGIILFYGNGFANATKISANSIAVKSSEVYTNGVDIGDTFNAYYTLTDGWYYSSLSTLPYFDGTKYVTITRKYHTRSLF